MRRLLSGNEAIAYGAWEAGVAVASGYPGTPSTEILEHLVKMPGIYAEWAPNEKVALDVAIGAAYAGKRAMATMKHVGVNVAADSLFYASMTGVEAGLVIISADDPAMHSSQNEQDNRQYAKFARIACFDPADSQEARDFTIAAFDLSEQFDSPVLLRPTTRICHTSTQVTIDSVRKEFPEPGKYPRNPSKYVMIPAFARGRHPVIEARIAKLTEFAETYELNQIEERSSDLGIITGGIAYQYAREVFPEASILKLGMVYPLPPKMIKKFAQSVTNLIVLEELDPFIEEQVRLMGIKLYRHEHMYPHTKSIFPLIDELNPQIVRESAIKAGLIQGEISSKEPQKTNFPNRPPVLCAGCPHRSTFYILSKLGLPVNGDIGCYTLGVVPPLKAIDTCGCMGAGIAVAHGAAVAHDGERHIAVIGDSTFLHTGIPALLNVAYNKSNVITIILDNRITGMTGHQHNPGTGKTLMAESVPQVDIVGLVRSLGIPTVATVEAFDVQTIEKTLIDWLKKDEPAVLIIQDECALLPSARALWSSYQVVEDMCNGCTICFRIGCPAIYKSEVLDPKYNRPLAEIDPLACTGCEICAQVCPRDAIIPVEINQ
ncbi:MAG: indolepyruvate ferredoxin oxidoreductase subunit alpha [Chloroflexota bacterium]